MTSDAASSAGVIAPRGGSRLAEKRRLLEGLRVPRPVVSTWGLANLEISVPIGSFPVDGAEETFVDGRIDAVVGGVAANVSRALGRLGVRVHANLVVGADGPGAQVRTQLDGWEGVGATVIPTPECPRTVVLYADDGQRHILMDPRAATSTDFPAAALDTIGRSQLAHVTLADIGRPVLHAASAAGVPVAVDLQAVTDIDSARVRTYAGAASVLFLSGAGLTSGQRLDTLRAIAARFDIPIAVMGMGSEGAAMTTDAGESVITTPAHSPGLSGRRWAPATRWPPGSWRAWPGAWIRRDACVGPSCLRITRSAQWGAPVDFLMRPYSAGWRPTPGGSLGWGKAQRSRARSGRPNEVRQRHPGFRQNAHRRGAAAGRTDRDPPRTHSARYGTRCSG